MLGLLAAASMSSAFVNTLFTQTVNFAADDFGVSDTGVGVAGSLVRAGIILVLPVAVLADRVGRRRVVTAMAVAAPVVTAMGAFAPSFPFLVATQAIGRPLGLALDFLVAVVAAEEMPRNSRAYAVSVLAMASGLGAGVAVMALPLADISASSWRLVYLVSLVWLLVAVDIARRLPETRRFERPHVIAPQLDRRRFAVLASVAMLANLFVAPASLFQNGYLEDVRGFSATTIAIFTIGTATPAGIGLILGGRIADVSGRKRLIAAGLPLATGLIVLSYSVGGPVMWLSVFLAGTLGGMTYPALAVYRTELFPTGNRGRAAGLITATALLGGIGGLLVMGTLLDRDWSHGSVMALLASAQVLVMIIVLRWYPETAHNELEDLNPEDAGQPSTSVPSCRRQHVLVRPHVLGGLSGGRLRPVLSAPPLWALCAWQRGCVRNLERTWIFRCSEPKAAGRTSYSRAASGPSCGCRWRPPCWPSASASTSCDRCSPRPRARRR